MWGVRQGAEGDEIGKGAWKVMIKDLRGDIRKMQRTSGNFWAEELTYLCAPQHVAHCLAAGSSFQHLSLSWHQRKLWPPTWCHALFTQEKNNAYALAYSNFLVNASAKISQVWEQSFSFIQGQIAASMLSSLPQTLLFPPWIIEFGPVGAVLAWEA